MQLENYFLPNSFWALVTGIQIFAFSSTIFLNVQVNAQLFLLFSIAGPKQSMGLSQLPLSQRHGRSGSDQQATPSSELCRLATLASPTVTAETSPTQPARSAATTESSCGGQRNVLKFEEH